MGINRVDKYLREQMSLSSLDAARGLRGRAVSVVVGTRPLSRADILVDAAVCLLLRCFTGEVWIDFGSDGGGDSEKLEVIVGHAREESVRVSGRDRILVGKAPLDAIRLGVGASLSGEVWVDAAGWDAAVNRPAPSEEPPLAAAACLAAALGVAKLFSAQVIGNPKCAAEEWAFSLWSMRASETKQAGAPLGERSLGKIGILGAGAIGSAIAFVLERSSMGGEVVVIDNEHYEEDNVDTTMMLSRLAAISGVEKAQYLAGELKRDGLNAVPHKERVNARSEVLGQPFDFFFCGVDNAETRRELDAVRAKLVINAGVGGTKLDAGHLIVSIHSEQRGLLSRLYPGSVAEGSPATELQGQVDGANLCSTIPYKNATMAAPFVALASAALAVGMAMREGREHHDELRVLKVDVLGQQSLMDRRR